MVLFENAVEAERSKIRGDFLLVHYQSNQINAREDREIVFLPREPLRLLFDACLEEEGGMMTCNVNADS